ncbi:MAG: glycosyltransferase [Sphaerochaeta sp.]|uniref:glycosyltransferase n=1 Tax=Sphaerochaeta sp. TaxID=1972642 RepID=UPI003D11A41B
MDHTKIIFDFETIKGYEPIYEQDVIDTGSKIFKNCRYRDGVLKCLHNQFKHIKADHYDIVYSQNGYDAAPQMLFAAILGVKRRIAHSHVANSPESIARKLRRKIFGKLVRLCATDLLACSKEAAVWAYGKKPPEGELYHIINNAIDLNLYVFDADKRADIRTGFSLDNNLVLGCVGRFSYQKNYSFLIDIFKSICQLKSNAVLVLIGDGELMPEIRGKVERFGLQEKVHFWGARTDVYHLLNAFDVFVLPSNYEGFGIVYVEAQAMGLPCYGSKEGVPLAAKVSDLMHYLSLSDSSETWAKEILTGCSSTFERRDTHDELVEAGFDIDVEARKFEHFLLNQTSNSAQR